MSTERKGSLGGSSAGTILGINKWGCLRKLAYTYLGLDKTDDIPDDSAIALGNLLEQRFINWAQDYLGEPLEQNTTWIHPEIPFIVGHPDGISGNTIVEVKTATEASYNRILTRGVYPSYEAQLTLYMGLAQRNEGLFIVANQDSLDLTPVVIPHEFDINMYTDIINGCINFVESLHSQGIPARCGKRENGLKNICSKCEYATLCKKN